MTVLTRIATRLRDDGGLLADVVVDPEAQSSAGWEPIEAIREGYLLHYAAPRVVVTDDADLALLAGDRLYALGLADLADLGDLEAVRTMAGVIAAAATAHAAGDAEAAEEAWLEAPREPSPPSGDR